MSKKTGFVSAEELNVIFDDDSITPEEIDEIYGFLKDNDIEIVSADLSDIPETVYRRNSNIRIETVRQYLLHCLQWSFFWNGGGRFFRSTRKVQTAVI